MIRVPDAPTCHLTDTGRRRLGTARVDLAPRCDYQDSMEFGRTRRPAADAGCVDFALCRDSRDSEDFGCACRRLVAGVGRVDLVLRRGCRDFAVPARACRRLVAGVGRVDLVLRRGCRDFA
ncbi:hypothetical protein AB0E64_13735, partial [Streptomyces caelestis]